MKPVRLLVAAAGKGTRSGLPYPKTLFEIDGVSILRRILTAASVHTVRPVIVVSPSGLGPIRSELDRHGLTAETVLQPEARGMGDAVLRFEEASGFDPAADETIVLIWGDVPFVSADTIGRLIALHRADDNVVSLVSKRVEEPYTVVIRDAEGRVTEVAETKERPEIRPLKGERDIGLFVFERTRVFGMLKQEIPTARSPESGEHGFLYCIGEIVRTGGRVGAYPIAGEREDISLNRLSDLDRRSA
jgi:bifunctional UDP-N-acetylglucosamine pyrophosphorylase/glucosamine-1-phosphate N-acetyltransferase